MKFWTHVECRAKKHPFDRQRNIHAANKIWAPDRKRPIPHDSFYTKETARNKLISDTEYSCTD